MIDWNSMWKENHDRGPKEEELKFWNDFAPRFRKKVPEGEDPYVEQFYEYSCLCEGETIFDMGCGSGTLAIPFAKRGHEVWAADFSPEMLKVLMDGAAEEGVEERIHPIRLDWDEDWAERDDLPVCDVAISSRSFICRDMAKALRDLESVARDRVCIGAWDTPVNGYVRELADAIGYDRPGYGCYVYIMGELMNRDRMPELRWITYPFRRTAYEGPEDALRQLRETFRNGLTPEQERMIEEYCEHHMVPCEKQGRQMWKLDFDEISTIAFIRWAIR